ncbi:COP9 signalosome complex subunit 3 [Lingula anatina]|uniref:COP9 signalosome complex subunit 3 n=1 Tax=Lingula anatina TaxID=7574 RepID=A0A1S3KEP4_LINAN|nr:COP9 signalosome complex subunit 3 [Lingula anatina]|eukprot:XP_013420972.1 COP9 signalosome complex subunit 3 [Lingula anatina]
MAAALEQYVNNVRTLSSQGNFSQLCEFISKSGDVLGKNASHLDNLLGALDLQEHSLGVLGILCIKYNLPNIPDFETLFVQTQEFINMCNGEQVRYATDSFAELCHRFTENLVTRRQPIRGISVLCKAVTKIQLHSSQLTSIHADLCQLCLLAKCFKPALQFLDADITEISKEGGQYDARHFLLYYYYGGMIYTGLKNYDRALYFFEIAITTPSMAVSHIMLESYKKHLLVALILHGKVPTLPKYTSQVVLRYIKPLCQAYHDVCTAYGTNNPTELRAAVTKNQEQFTRDNNMGLIKQCITSLYKKNIQRLTKTFLTLSLADMANRVQLATPREAEKYVLHMIEDGEIFATINQKDGMVSFLDNPEKYNSVDMLMQLDQEMQKCIDLDNKLKSMDRDIAVNPQYVQKSAGLHDEDMQPASTSKGTGY